MSDQNDRLRKAIHAFIDSMEMAGFERVDIGMSLARMGQKIVEKHDRQLKQEP